MEIIAVVRRWQEESRKSAMAGPSGGGPPEGGKYLCQAQAFGLGPTRLGLVALHVRRGWAQPAPRTAGAQASSPHPPEGVSPSWDERCRTADDNALLKHDLALLVGPTR
jgi:hypothetical protein